MKIQIAGKEIEAVPVTYQGESVIAGSLLLDDGTVIKIQLLVQQVLRLDGEKDPLGRQAYFIQHATFVTTT